MPKYEINVNNQKYQINSEKELNQNDFDNIVSDIQRQQTTQKIKDLPKTALNVGRKIGQGLTFGQGAHIEGINEAYGGAIYNALHGKNPFKDIKSDYLHGREQAKKDYKQFDEEHPILSIGSEIVGSLPTGGGIAGGLSKLGKVGKLAKILNTPTKAAIEGATYGGAYGLSNTEGKDIDLKNALLGAGIGASLGGGLGLASKTLSKNQKEIKDVVNSYKDFGKQVANPKEMFLNKPMTEKEIEKAAKEGKQLTTVGMMAKDENIPEHLLKMGDEIKAKASMGDKRALRLKNEMEDSQFAYRDSIYMDNLNENLSGVLPTIKDIGNEIYKPFNNATFIADEKSILDTINKFENKEVRERAKKAVSKLLNKPKTVVPTNNQPEIVNGWQILQKETAPKVEIKPTTMQELREAKQELYDLAQEIMELDATGRPTVNNSLGGRRAMKDYDTLRNLLTEQAGNQIKGLREADKIYSIMLNANSDLVSAFGKKYSNGDVVNKVLAEIRDRKMPTVSRTLNKIENSINNELPRFQNSELKGYLDNFKNLMESITDNTKLLQASYALKPQNTIPTVGKRLNKRVVLKTLLDEYNNPAKKFSNFMKYADVGAINKPARKANVGMFGNQIEKKAAQDTLFSVPKKSLYTKQEINNMKKTISDLYNSRFSKLLSNGGLLPKSTIRLLMQQYYK